MEAGTWSNRSWAAAWLLLLVLGATLVVRMDIAQRREAFLAEARNAHRVLSQGAARIDAVLGTLLLLAPPTSTGPTQPVGGEQAAARAEDKLPELYPQVRAAWRRDVGGRWSGVDEAAAALAAADARSAAMPPAQRHAVLAAVDAARGEYTLVQAGAAATYALRIDALRLAPAEEWPWPDDAPVLATLTHGEHTIVLKSGPSHANRPQGLTGGFESSKLLAAPSQPFTFQARRFVGPAEWPWLTLAVWALASAATMLLLRRLRHARLERQRAGERVRLARVARLNTLGELAAGVAHELNQPLTAVLASTQTALRVLRDDVDADGAIHDPAVAIRALELGAGQARRAADVVARLRRLVQQPASASARRPVDVDTVARRIVDLHADELASHAIEVGFEGRASAARADSVAVEQILNNLLTNAMQALEASPASRPHRVVFAFALAQGGRVRCSVRDNGTGFAPDALPRLFEPFYTTREGGLGLGLSLCQSLALAMDGTLEARAVSPHGAEFTLELPAA